MSIKLMSAVWEMDLPDSEKLVLLALADWAGDDGRCWPSVGQMAKKCSKSERTVQATLRSLCGKGLLRREDRPGKGTIWFVNPRSDCTPAAASPVQPTTETPAAVAPNTLRTTKAQKDKPSVPRARAVPTRLPMDWKPSEDDLSYARQRGFGPSQTDDIAADFLTYWTLGKGRNTTHLNWSAAWQQWVRKEKPRADRDEAEARAASTIEARPGESESATKFRRAIAEEIGERAYRSWIEKLSIRVDGDRVALVAASSFVADQIRNNMGAHIQRVGKALFAGRAEVVILAATQGRRAA